MIQRSYIRKYRSILEEKASKPSFMTQEVEDEPDNVIFKNMKQCFIKFQIYNR